MESELLTTFSENLCQPLPAEILPGRPEMLTSTLVSSHTDGSGSGDSDSSGAEVLGAGVVLVADALGEAVADSVAVALGSAVVEVLGAGSVAVSDAEALGAGSLVSSPADSLAEADGDGSSVA
ncbi:hypothetical protein GCM10010216_13630 [Streptomyces flaveolus]|nr:hypothetical protein GCM10010216_13630 [Streptomyces flaveolus]